MAEHPPAPPEESARAAARSPRLSDHAGWIVFLGVAVAAVGLALGGRAIPARFRPSSAPPTRSG